MKINCVQELNQLKVTSLLWLLYLIKEVNEVRYWGELQDTSLFL